MRRSLPALRRRRSSAGLCLPLLLLLGCDDAAAPSSSTVITSGYSFGECLGFCFHEMTSNGVVATYVRRDFHTGATAVISAGASCGHAAIERHAGRLRRR